ncbi:PP2C family protein-serine/threonine phosphatase [Streptomyces sp. NPDC059373]
MSGEKIDYAAVFQALPGAAALLTPQLVVADVNDEYLRLAGKHRWELVGRHLLDVFPDNPANSGATGMRHVQASLRRVTETGERESMALQRYDVEVPGHPGTFEERYWSPVNTPVVGPDGQVTLIVHRVEEVTELIRRQGTPDGDDRQRVLEADLYTRARELQEVNDRLRQANAREREVALALQEAMLPAPQPVGPHLTAVRYRPATTALNVCGDWYDLVVLPDERCAVAVGDVVGHGLAAACVMGQLRSALSAAVRVAEGPAQALEGLELYARSVPGAESTTAVQAVIDDAAHTITYSSAGHPPPVLVSPGGTVEFLDQATDPPLAARPDQRSRPQAGVSFRAGGLLALYTDGLIERRREDIDTGLARLAESLVRHGSLDPESLADALLDDLTPAHGTADDTALVVIRL